MFSHLLAAVAVVLLLLLLCFLAWAYNGHLRAAMAARGRSQDDQLQDLARLQKNAEYEQLRATLWRQRCQPARPRYNENDIYRLFEDQGGQTAAPTEHPDARMPVTMSFPQRR
jgi:cbb3-type cytochrome oxidase subunit 3